MGPALFYLTAYRGYLGKAPLMAQCIAPEQGCLFEAGQLYGGPWILGKTGTNPDSGQASEMLPILGHLRG